MAVAPAATAHAATSPEALTSHSKVRGRHVAALAALMLVAGIATFGTHTVLAHASTVTSTVTTPPASPTAPAAPSASNATVHLNEQLVSVPGSTSSTQRPMTSAAGLVPTFAASGATATANATRIITAPHKRPVLAYGADNVNP